MTLKRISEVSPLIGAFLVFLGYFKMNTYYSHWNINIYSYLDFSEITLSFLNDSNTLLFFIFLLFTQATIGYVTINAIDERKKKKLGFDESKKIVTENNELHLVEIPFDGVMEAFRKSYEVGFKATIFFMAIMFSVSFAMFLVLYNLPTLYISFMLIVQLLLIFIEKIVGIKNINQQIQISSIITLIGFSFCLAQYDINKAEKYPTKVTLYTESGEAIKSSNKILFLGKTNNFYIMYDNVKKISVILRKDDINRVEYYASY